MKIIKYLLFILVFLVFASSLEAQSAKKMLKAGNKSLKANKTEEAITHYTKALELNPTLSKAYLNRSKAYLELGEIEKAIFDLDEVNRLDLKDEESWLNNGNLNYNKDDYAKAAEKYAQYLLEKDKDIPVYNRQIECLMIIEDYERALQFAKKKLEVEKLPETYYQIAQINFILKNYRDAEINYKDALKEASNNIDYRNGLALSLYEQARYDAAITEANRVLRQDKNNKVAYLTRARSSHKKIEYSNAINDMSHIIVLYPNDKEIVDYLNYRGDLYLEYSQHMNAISDYSKSIGKDPENTYALFKRAQAYEEVTNTKEAIADLEKVVAIGASGGIVSASILSNSKTKVYNLRREAKEPIISLTNENYQDQRLRITYHQEQIDLQIYITDDNTIENISLEGNSLTVESNKGKVKLTEPIDLTGKEYIEIKAEDIYGNSASTRIFIYRVENNAPLVNFMLPYTNDNKEMLLDSDESRVYFEGNITDESLIKSILIDGILIPFNQEEYNPIFATNLDLRNKTKLTIKVIDIYDNILEEDYFLNREDALYAANSPMGKTWIVFIENSEYEYFASLDGPVKDIRLMKTALANYEVHNIIHRKDLTKKQMERFFSIELRDMVKNNQVNSLIVWYAGHGKFQNETGYWIPVDAERSDEFSYFNINNLKASMQVYSNEITHTLVITDACESGPSFYQAMRDDIVIRSCSEEKAIKYKSSQVLSSAGYELASDNSQFTMTFANTLINNSDYCIPIESIVLNVGDAVTKDNQQKPQFGKIAGLQDENGTFFFIKRSETSTTDDDK